MKLPSFLKQKSAAGRTADRDAAKAVAVEPKIKKPLIDIKQVADDFKTLDPKDPGLWPVIPRAIILLGIFSTLVGAAWWFGWNVQLEELAAKEVEESTLKDDWLNKKKLAVNLDAHKAQLAEINTSFGELLKQLPNKSEIDVLLVDINKTAQSRGLLVDLFKPGNDVYRDFYAEVPITLQLSGEYHDIGSFSGDIAQLPRIVTLNDIELARGAGNLLVLKTTAKTFRYLDDEEIAQRRKAQQGAKKK